MWQHDGLPRPLRRPVPAFGRERAQGGKQTDLNSIPQPSKRFTERLPLIADRPVRAYALTILICVVALVLRWELDPLFPPGYPYLTFFPAVIISSFLFGPRPGILAAVLCGLMSWYFLIPPRLSFALESGTVTALLFYVGVVTVDIALVHLMQAANRRLADTREDLRQMAEERGLLAERTTVLFEELQHRVGNNLQMVGAVLALQLRNLQEPTARRALSDAAQRLQVIGNIQRRLYKPDGERVPLDAYIHDLVDKVRASSGREGISWTVLVEPGIILRPERAVPVALILSEAIANSLEHGLPDRERGLIVVSAAREHGQVVLQVTDDGAGLPAGFDPERGDSIGLRISRVLAQQIDAHYALEPSPSGTVMRLVLPESGEPTVAIPGTG